MIQRWILLSTIFWFQHVSAQQFKPLDFAGQSFKANLHQHLSGAAHHHQQQHQQQPPNWLPKPPPQNFYEQSMLKGHQHQHHIKPEESGQQQLLDNSNDTVVAKIDVHFGNPSLPYNLTNAVGKVEVTGNVTVQYDNWASENQDLCTLALLQGHKGTTQKFFVEAGAYTGEDLSNTLLLEKKHNWTGLLIEPNPFLFHRIQQLNRQCAVINAGISPKNKTKTIPFRLAGPLGGIVTTLSDQHKNRIDGEVKYGADWTKQNEGKGEIVNVPCHPFERMLLAAGNKNLIVDYFSLDTEGSEVAILRSIDFRRITFGVIGIEHNNVQGRKDYIIQLMNNAGYIQHKNISWAIDHADVIFYNPVYFTERKISTEHIKQISCR